MLHTSFSVRRYFITQPSILLRRTVGPDHSISNLRIQISFFDGILEHKYLKILYYPINYHQWDIWLPPEIFSTCCSILYLIKVSQMEEEQQSRRQYILTIATLVDLDYNVIELPKYLLPLGVKPGGVIKLALSHDVKEEQRRQKQVQKIQKDLQFKQIGSGNKILEE